MIERCKRVALAGNWYQVILRIAPARSDRPQERRAGNSRSAPTRSCAQLCDAAALESIPVILSRFGVVAGLDPAIHLARWKDPRPRGDDRGKSIRARHPLRGGIAVPAQETAKETCTRDRPGL